MPPSLCSLALIISCCLPRYAIPSHILWAPAHLTNTAHDHSTSTVRQSVGHFALRLVVGGRNATTECLDWHASEESWEAALRGLPAMIDSSTDDDSTSLYVAVNSSGDGRRGGASSPYGYTRHVAFSSSSSSSSSFFPEVSLSLVRRGCDAIWTWGRWEDASQWRWLAQSGGQQLDELEGSRNGSSSVVPGAAGETFDGQYFPAGSISSSTSPRWDDVVVVPQGAGFLQVTQASRVVQSLIMLGGTLVTGDSSCPSGWSKPSRATTTTTTTKDKAFMSGVGVGGGANNELYGAPMGSADTSGATEGEFDDFGESSSTSSAWGGGGGRSNSWFGGLPDRQRKCFAPFRNEEGRDWPAAMAFCAALSPCVVFVVIILVASLHLNRSPRALMLSCGCCCNNSDGSNDLDKPAARADP